MPLPRPSLQTGFSMIEILVAVAIVGILATLAVPGLLNSVTRDQVLEAAPLANVAKKAIGAEWAAAQALPADNAAAGLPVPSKFVNNYVTSLAVENGAIHITFGNSANRALTGRVLTMRPAVVEDTPVVPVAWVCGFAAVPGGMAVKGENRTDIAASLLPVNCRG
jgi:type IV pilus assembly protein PilA